MKPMNPVKATGPASCTLFGRGWGRRTHSHSYQILQTWEKCAKITVKYDATFILIYWTDADVSLQTSSCERGQGPSQWHTKTSRSLYLFADLMEFSTVVVNNMQKNFKWFHMKVEVSQEVEVRCIWIRTKMHKTTRNAILYIQYDLCATFQISLNLCDIAYRFKMTWGSLNNDFNFCLKLT